MKATERKAILSDRWNKQPDVRFGPAKPRPTRYAALGYRWEGPGLWRIVDISHGQDASTGLPYRTRTELLADLDRFASAYGCKEAAQTAAQGPTRQTMIDALRAALWIADVAVDADMNGRKATGCVRDGVTNRQTYIRDVLTRLETTDSPTV